MHQKRTAIITDANMHVGPDLARELASNHNLVLGEPAVGLVEEVTGLGADASGLDGVADLSDPESIKKLVEHALAKYGRLDAACIRTGRIITGKVSGASVEDLRKLPAQNIESVLFALQALIPPMLDNGGGQIVIVTSASGGKPTPMAALYSATRAAANMLVRNAAAEVADKNICINAVGTNYLDYPGFRAATGADDPKIKRAIEAQIPMNRLGLPAEAAHFVASLFDGKNRFQTGQFFSISGGWG
ncbi:MAG: SDR family oxidoreductase [Pseudomonadales bacterium]|nr:SDR family oxidoreductase [Pseudomonadales bacterium]